MAVTFSIYGLFYTHKRIHENLEGYAMWTKRMPTVRSLFSDNAHGSLKAENYNNDVKYILWPSQSLSLIHEEFHPFSWVH